MSDPLFDLTGRVALVTGAASGMGRAMSLALAQHGADLMLADLNGEGLQKTTEQILALGRRVVAVSCNVSEPKAIGDLFALLDKMFGRIDFLGNVAGEGIMAPPLEITGEQVQTVFQNLVFSRFLMCQEAGKRMLAAGRGSIVNIGSLASTSALGRGHIPTAWRWARSSR